MSQGICAERNIQRILNMPTRRWFTAQFRKERYLSCTLRHKAWSKASFVLVNVYLDSSRQLTTSKERWMPALIAGNQVHQGV